MFTIEQIKQAHSKVKSGADFPTYIQDLIVLGITRYVNHVKDGQTIYYGKNNFELPSPPKYPIMEITPRADSVLFIQQLKTHQQGKTDYPTFCSDCARTGVEKWIVDMAKMTCTYYDWSGNKILSEIIPQV